MHMIESLQKKHRLPADAVLKSSRLLQALIGFQFEEKVFCESAFTDESHFRINPAKLLALKNQRKRAVKEANPLATGVLLTSLIDEDAKKQSHCRCGGHCGNEADGANCWNCKHCCDFAENLFTLVKGKQTTVCSDCSVCPMEVIRSGTRQNNPIDASVSHGAMERPDGSRREDGDGQDGQHQQEQDGQEQHQPSNQDQQGNLGDEQGQQHEEAPPGWTSSALGLTFEAQPGSQSTLELAIVALQQNQDHWKERHESEISKLKAEHAREKAELNKSNTQPVDDNADPWHCFHKFILACTNTKFRVDALSEGQLYIYHV